MRKCFSKKMQWAQVQFECIKEILNLAQEILKMGPQEMARYISYPKDKALFKLSTRNSKRGPRLKGISTGLSPAGLQRIISTSSIHSAIPSEISLATIRHNGSLRPLRSEWGTPVMQTHLSCGWSVADRPLFQFRAFVFKYAQHNPDQRHAIQSVLETLIQSDLTSSAPGCQQVADAMSSTSQFHASPNILDDSGPHCSADRRGKDRNKSIVQRRGTRGKSSSILVPDKVASLSSAGIEENVQVQRISKSVKAEAL